VSEHIHPMADLGFVRMATGGRLQAARRAENRGIKGQLPTQACRQNRWCNF